MSYIEMHCRTCGNIVFEYGRVSPCPECGSERLVYIDQDEHDQPMYEENDDEEEGTEED